MLVYRLGILFKLTAVRSILSETEGEADKTYVKFVSLNDLNDEGFCLFSLADLTYK